MEAHNTSNILSSLSLLFLFLFDVCWCQNATSDDSRSGSPASVYNSQAVLSGLYCYECRETYTKTYDPYNSPCRHNLSQVIVRQCAASDRYCKVERLDIPKFGTVLSMHRGCTKDCLYGCRFNGLALTYMRCTSCCNIPGCNTGNTASQVLSNRNWIMASIFISILTVRES